MSEIYSDAFLKDILKRSRRVAVVGVSMNPVRPSYYVARYLSLKGFTVIPVNPGHAGETLFGQTVRAHLSDIEGGVDMIDIFRRSEHVTPIVEEALALFPKLQTIWMQIGVENAEAAAMAQARRARGCLFADARTIDGVHHTLSVWTGREAMLAYLCAGAHGRAMRLFPVIAEGRTMGFAATEAPDWPQAVAIWRAQACVV
jgi:predicted CoA-binding protein